MGKIPGLKYSTTWKGSKLAPKKIAITTIQMVKNTKLKCPGRFVEKIKIPKSDCTNPIITIVLST
jgi:hypothetical protein